MNNEDIDFEKLYERIQQSCPNQTIPILGGMGRTSDVVKILIENSIVERHVFTSKEIQSLTDKACLSWGDITREQVRQIMIDWAYYGIAI